MPLPCLIFTGLMQTGFTSFSLSLKFVLCSFSVFLFICSCTVYPVRHFFFLLTSFYGCLTFFLTTYFFCAYLFSFAIRYCSIIWFSYFVFGSFHLLSVILNGQSSMGSFLITWWPWKPMQLDGHLDWLHFGTSGSQNNCTCSCIVYWHDSFRSRGIKMKSIKVAIQLHWFPWSPRYEKLVYFWHLYFAFVEMAAIFFCFVLLSILLSAKSGQTNFVLLLWI